MVVDDAGFFFFVVFLGQVYFIAEGGVCVARIFSSPSGALILCF